MAPRRGPAGTNSRHGWSPAPAGGGVLLFPEDPASPPLPGAAAAFSARSPWILRFTRAPARARKSSDRLHPSSLPEAEPEPPRPKFGWSAIGALRRQDERRGSGAAGAQWLPAQGKTHRSNREEQTWSSQPRASERWEIPTAQVSFFRKTPPPSARRAAGLRTRDGTPATQVVRRLPVTPLPTYPHASVRSPYSRERVRALALSLPVLFLSQYRLGFCLSRLP